MRARAGARMPAMPHMSAWRHGQDRRLSAGAVRSSRTAHGSRGQRPSPTGWRSLVALRPISAFSGWPSPSAVTSARVGQVVPASTSDAFTVTGRETSPFPAVTRTVHAARPFDVPPRVPTSAPGAAEASSAAAVDTREQRFGARGVPDDLLPTGEPVRGPAVDERAGQGLGGGSRAKRDSGLGHGRRHSFRAEHLGDVGTRTVNRKAVVPARVVRRSARTDRTSAPTGAGRHRAA